MLEGKMEHQDSAGNKGLLDDGGMQWMTAGAGILHSEMPKQTDGRLWGFQLWSICWSPENDKAQISRYSCKDIPEVEGKGYKVRVLAGQFQGQAGAAETLTEVSYLDVHLDGGGRVDIEIPDGHNLVVFAYSGRVKTWGCQMPQMSNQIG